MTVAWAWSFPAVVQCLTFGYGNDDEGYRCHAVGTRDIQAARRSFHGGLLPMFKGKGYRIDETGGERGLQMANTVDPYQIHGFPE